MCPPSPLPVVYHLIGLRSLSLFFLSYFLPPHNLIPFFLSPCIISFFNFLFHPVFNPLLSLPSFSFPPPLQIIHFLFFNILPTFAYWQSFLSRQSFIPSISLPSFLHHHSFLHLFLLLQPLLSNSIPLFLTRFIISVLLLQFFFYHSIPFFLPPPPSHLTLHVFLFHLTSVLSCFLCYSSAFFLPFSFLLGSLLFTVLCNSLEPPLISLFCLQEPRLSCNFWSGFELWFSRLSQEHSKVFWN